MTIVFDQKFEALKGNAPFPWQRRLFDRFLAGEFPACTLPTGLGKTSVVAVWLLALATSPRQVPRRLVYVVNRRTVVDQTTNEAEKFRRRLLNPAEVKTSPLQAALHQFIEALQQLYQPDPKADDPGPLAISTLRGQFADNQQWSTDPARPAIIVGTVDMIGSRLLFHGYGVGFKGRPLHAGFLGQDALLVHDEAHLEPAFQALLETIREEQTRCKDFAAGRVMELTATPRNAAVEPFELNDQDFQNSFVNLRLNAFKAMTLHPCPEENKLVETIAGQALAHRVSGLAILIFLRQVDDAEKVRARLAKEKFTTQVQVLTGTLHGQERERMTNPRQPAGCPIFARFLPRQGDHAPEEERWQVVPQAGMVDLICTSAGEVGVNLSADHLVCDLSSMDSMMQRFGRVNRFGERDETQIDVVHPTEFDDTKPLEVRRQLTLALLERLPGQASPAALDQRPRDERIAAFAPTPVLLTATDILFDAWALTSIRDRLPGRPSVEPYLHGVAESDPPETTVAWREEVGWLSEEQLNVDRPEDLLDDSPLPHELLRDQSKRIFSHLKKLADAHSEARVWLLQPDGTVQVVTLKHLVDRIGADRLADVTVLLPPSVGGLTTSGQLDGTAMWSASQPTADDETVTPAAVGVTDDVSDTQTRKRRQRWLSEPEPTFDQPMRLIRSLTLSERDADEDSLVWEWYEAPKQTGLGAAISHAAVEWEVHNADVATHTQRILSGLALPPEIAVSIQVAAKFHDYGKHRRVFQAVFGNRQYPAVVLAKSDRRGSRIPERYRHEFGSLADARAQADFLALDEQQQDLALHLIAAHHGRARPHFPHEEAYDLHQTEAEAAALTAEVPRRFARLQRRFGRWGLAYLESLLRAADYAASAHPSQTWESPS